VFYGGTCGKGSMEVHGLEVTCGLKGVRCVTEILLTLVSIVWIRNHLAAVRKQLAVVHVS